MVSSNRTSALSDLTLQRLNIDRTVDVKPLAIRIALDWVLLSALNPTASDHRVMLRMGRIHEIDRVTLIAVFLGISVLFNECFLNLLNLLNLWSRMFTGFQFGFLVDVAQAV